MRTVASVVVALVVSLGRVASADPVPKIPTQLLSPATVDTEGGSHFELPSGWWLLPPDDVPRIDLELKTCQDDRTRALAENRSLKESLREIDPAWYYVLGAVVAGFGAGVVYAELR